MIPTRLCLLCGAAEAEYFFNVLEQLPANCVASTATTLVDPEMMISRLNATR